MGGLVLGIGELTQSFSVGEPLDGDKAYFTLINGLIVLDLPAKCLSNENLTGTIKNPGTGFYDDNIQVEVPSGELLLPRDLPDGHYHLAVKCSSNEVTHKRNDSGSEQESNGVYQEAEGITTSFVVADGSIADPNISEGSRRFLDIDPSTSNLRSEERASRKQEGRKLDEVFSDDVIVDGSMCVGHDCSNGVSFGSDTIRLKENNLRIHFQDTSSSASFPGNDWRIIINDSTNGGEDHFSIEDSTGGNTVFKIIAGAPENSLYVDADGEVGVGTSTPKMELHVVDGDGPTLRLEQDTTNGWDAQIFDIVSNESNFFIRDVTNGSLLPFRIFPNAPTNSFVISENGDIGLGKQKPDKALHIQEKGGTPTIRLDDNSQDWDISGDTSGFSITDASSSTLPFQIESGASTDSMYVDLNGNVGIGTNTPGKKLHVAGDIQFDGLINGVDFDTLKQNQHDELQTLSLTGSDLYISSGNSVDLSNIGHQEINFDGSTLSISEGSNTVDLSDVGRQELSLDGSTLSISEGSNTVDLSNVGRQELSLDGSTLSISGGTTTADLSNVPARVTLQAALENLDGNDGDKVDIKYGGKAGNGWTMIQNGRILGMSVSTNEPLDGSNVNISVVKDSIVDGSITAGGTLTISDGSSRGYVNFDTALDVSAGDVIKFQVTIDGDEGPDKNAGSLVLLLEQ